MKTRIIALLGMVLPFLIVGQLKAAVNDSSRVNTPDTTVPFQITLITPLGTNGLYSARSTNYFSLNVIAGYNGGVEGIEIGGFANVLRNNMQGTQIAGFSNTVFREMQGVQIAGFANVVTRSSEGMMLAGFTNHAGKSSKVVQMAGFSNQVIGSVSGAQLAGFVNIATDSVKGAQLAGFGNFSAKQTQALQASGFINTSLGEVQGGQIAGFANIAENVDGVQISGFINLAKKVKGLQIGFINVADTFEAGVPIGFLSFVRNGYHNFSIGTNELLWAEGQFRCGVSRFYNIFSVAFSPVPGRTGWEFGYGLGSVVMSKPKSEIALELVGYHVNEEEIWTNATNELFRFSPRYTYHPGAGRFGIWAAPSLNLQVISDWDEDEGFESKLAPYTMLEDEGRYATTKFWVGEQVGISF